jgi:aryl sulfotransferase
MADRQGGLRSQFQQPLGTWSQHVTSWLDEAGLPLCLLRYEDMLAAPVDHLTRVARFLGMPTENAAAAIKAVQFGRLQELEKLHGFRERPNTAPRFFVRGRAGAWKDILSGEQQRRLEHDHGHIMSRLGYL